MLKQQTEKYVTIGVDKSSGNDMNAVSVMRGKKLLITFKGKYALLEAHIWAKVNGYKMNYERKV